MSSPKQPASRATEYDRAKSSQGGIFFWFWAVILGLATVVLYWPATGCGFTGYDDPIYYSVNRHIQAGLTWSSVVWAFSTGAASNWHPLTWLSLMLDASISGNPQVARTPHLTNIVLHGLNAILLYVFLRRTTSHSGSKWLSPEMSAWGSLTVAALFATHPLNVESVVWIAERKNVLCMFFFLGALLAYERYVRGCISFKQPVSGLTSGWRRGEWGWWWLSLLWFACALMSKPLAVPLPFVLLLLDFWPLGRINLVDWRIGAFARVVWEKLPFFLLTVASCVVTYFVQQHGNSVRSFEAYPFAGRLENALVSYGRYLAKAVWPVELSILYPYPHHWPAAIWSSVGGLLLVASLVALRCLRAMPFIPLGWFWFIGTMVPMIGLLQVGEQSMADRYAYLPLVGVFLMVVWAALGWFQRNRVPVWVLLAVGSAMVVLCSVQTRLQLAFWKDDGALFSHALTVTRANYPAEVNYGAYLVKANETEEAIQHYRRALAIDSSRPAAHFNLAGLLDQKGDTEGAISQYRAALQCDPTFCLAAYELAQLLERAGRREEAIAQYRLVLKFRPEFRDTSERLHALGGVPDQVPPR